MDVDAQGAMHALKEAMVHRQNDRVNYHSQSSGNFPKFALLFFGVLI